MIAVVSLGRSGSSLVAGLLYDAGVWFGSCRGADRWNPTGHFENHAIKRRLYESYGQNWLGEPPKRKINVDDILESQGYEEPWAVKHGAFYAHVWENPTFIRVYRPLEKVLESYERCGWLKGHGDPEEIVTKHRQIMDGLGGFRIDSDRLIEGDHRQMEKIGEHLGLTLCFNRINKDLWH